MSNGNGQTPTPRQTMHGGELGKISELLQAKAPEAIEQIPAARDETRAPQNERDVKVRTEGVESPAADQGGADELLTADELEAQAQTAADELKKKEGDPDAETKLKKGDPAAEVSVGELAERLGIDARRLYEDLRIPLREGRGSISLSELKEGYQDHAILEDQRDALATDRQTLQTDSDAAVREVETATRLLAAQVGAENLEPLLAHSRKLNSEHIEKGRKTILERFPEWSDSGVYNKARDDMAETAKVFGFTRAELEAETDPRRVILLHALTEVNRRVAAARAKIEAPATPTRQRAPSARTPSPPKGARQANRLTRQAKASGRREDQVQAISAVLARE